MVKRHISYLMIYRWFGQRWDREGQELAVAVFVHDLLQNQREGGKDKKICVTEGMENSLVHSGNLYWELVNV